MPRVMQHAPGAPCWFELGTTDQSGAKDFYSKMFGWTVYDYPMGPAGSYTLFQLNSKDVGGGYTLMPEQVEQKVPPHWLVYFNTEDADATCAKAVELGGKVIKEIMDVMGLGRMALLQDPGGAYFAIWEPRMFPGAGLINETHTVCWSELSTRQSDAVIPFYSALFGWDAKPSKGSPTEYNEFSVAGEPRGGILQMNEKWEGIPSHWQIYIQVEDCKAAAAKVAESGGKVCVPPFEAGDIGWISVINDPQGAFLSIIQLKQQHPA